MAKQTLSETLSEKLANRNLITQVARMNAEIKAEVSEATAPMVARARWAQTVARAQTLLNAAPDDIAAVQLADSLLRPAPKAKAKGEEQGQKGEQEQETVPQA